MCSTRKKSQKRKNLETYGLIMKFAVHYSSVVPTPAKPGDRWYSSKHKKYYIKNKLKRPMSTQLLAAMHKWQAGAQLNIADIAYTEWTTVSSIQFFDPNFQLNASLPPTEDAS